MAKMMVKERSLSDLFEEAQDAWGRIEEGESMIKKLREQIKVWRAEIEDARCELAKIFKEPDEDEEEEE
jgi:hypothetical protein